MEIHNLHIQFIVQKLSLPCRLKHSK